jgi:hypothetical protein
VLALALAALAAAGPWPPGLAQVRADASIYVVARPAELVAAYSAAGLALQLQPEVARSLLAASDAMGFAVLDRAAWAAVGLRFEGEAVVAVAGLDSEAPSVEIVLPIADPARFDALRRRLDAEPGAFLHASATGTLARFVHGKPPPATGGLGRGKPDAAAGWLARPAPLRAYAPARGACGGDFAATARHVQGALQLAAGWSDRAALPLAAARAGAVRLGDALAVASLVRAPELTACPRSEDPIARLREAPRALAVALERAAAVPALREARALDVTLAAALDAPAIARAAGRDRPTLRADLPKLVQSAARPDSAAERAIVAFLTTRIAFARAYLSTRAAMLLLDLAIEVRP